MTWRKTTVIDERKKFIAEALDRNSSLNFSQLCNKYNISRKSGYKWLIRFQTEGENGLVDKDRAPIQPSNKRSKELVEHVTNLKQQFSKFGPKKIHAKLLEEAVLEEVPCVNTIGNILTDLGLTTTRKYRKHVANTTSLCDCTRPNQVWQYDFKGWFLTGDGKKCEPLTITDGFSRYLITLKHLDRKTTEYVWNELEKAFYEYGLPVRIRSDNGPPFATTGIGRLSPLAIKLIKAGVTPEWIEPGCPEQNGRHERFHLTLKQEVAAPPAFTHAMQLIKFEQFKTYYNEVRPHEALGQVVPAKRYRVSPRQWNGKLQSPEYGDEYQKRKVDKGGLAYWGGMRFFVSESLYQEYIGIKEEGIDKFGVYYGPILLGEIDLRKGFKRT